MTELIILAPPLAPLHHRSACRNLDESSPSLHCSHRYPQFRNPCPRTINFFCMDPRKKMVRRFAHMSFLQSLARLILRAEHVLDRFWSHLRFRTLVPNAGDSLCHWTVTIKHPHNLQIGDRVRIGHRVMIGAGSPIIIGDDVVISQGAMIETGGAQPNQEPPYPRFSKPITIERGAWIAAGAIVLGGVTIGQGAIVGAGTVISRDIPPYAIVNSAPNRMLIRKKTTQGNPVPETTE